MKPALHPQDRPMELPLTIPTGGALRPSALRSLILKRASVGLNRKREAESPLVVAVNGRSASGKSTLAKALADEQGWAAVATDDVAWWHSFFGWSDLLIDGVLRPALRGEEVSYRPPAWEERSRRGAIHVPKGTAVLVIEGVGASRLELMPFIDYSIWLKTDLPLINRREAERAKQGEVTPELQQEWMAEEFPFLDHDKPWERADLILTAHAVSPACYQELLDEVSL